VREWMEKKFEGRIEVDERMGNDVGAGAKI
jgi:hypothetical protein